MATDSKKRIAIVGGGPGGMSAAWHLKHGDSADQLDVTVYTMGWRLGGKGATGRGPNGRIQEHGIHGFAGFYWNSTRMLDTAYRELGHASKTTAPHLPTSIDEALIGNTFSIDPLFADGRFTEHPLIMPSSEGAPWEGEPGFDLDHVIENILSMAHGTFTGKELPHGGWKEGPWHRLIRTIMGTATSRVGRAIEKAIEHAAEADHDAMLRELDRVLEKLIGHALRGNDAARSQFVTLDYLTTLIRGMLADGILDHGFELDSLDGENYIEWLQRHDIHPVTLETGTPNAPAFICFLFPGGDSSLSPSMSAASYLSWVIRGFLSSGAAYMFFRAGTGETIIKPLYETAAAAGVEVEFFHKLQRVELTADGTNVERLVFRRQARLADGVERYHPLVKLDGTDVDVWPDRPVWEQLNPDDVAGIKAARPRPENDLQPAPEHADLESYWSEWIGVDDVVLERERDFDYVVLALPPSTFPYVCPALVDGDTVLRTAMEGQPTCATFGLQLWTNRSLADLGWDRTLNSAERYAGASFPNPYNVMVDFTDLIAYEAWTVPPTGLLYMCGPVADVTDPLAHDFSDHRYPQIQLERALTLSAQYLATAATWLPKAARDRPADTLGLDPETLVATEGRDGIGRLADQYMKTNIDPSERYVMAPPGSAAARPMAWGSGVDNLVFAGDWIYTGINVGSFEGAVMSGKLASFALSGSPRLEDVYGFDLLHGDLDVSRVEPRIPPRD